MSSVAEKLARKGSRRPPAKQVRLRLVYIDFWSAVKLSFLVAVCLAVVNIVASFLVFTIVQSTGLATVVLIAAVEAAPASDSTATAL